MALLMRDAIVAENDLADTYALLPRWVTNRKSSNLFKDTLGNIFCKRKAVMMLISIDKTTCYNAYFWATLFLNSSTKQWEFNSAKLIEIIGTPCK